MFGKEEGDLLRISKHGSTGGKELLQVSMLRNALRKGSYIRFIC